MFNSSKCALVGMVHLLPLPGSPGFAGDIAAIRSRALTDADALLEGGVDALLVENMGDLPYLRGTADPVTVAAMAPLVAELSQRGVPVGVQVLAAANLEALAIAAATGAQFIRVEAFAYAAVADEGWLDACAGPLLRERARLGCDVQIWADVHKKHSSHSVTADLELGELAAGHAFCGADALVITGRATGSPTSLHDVRAAKQAGLPVAVGSGVDLDDAGVLAAVADALIVGSALKEAGQWRNPVETSRVRAIRAAMG